MTAAFVDQTFSSAEQLNSRTTLAAEKPRARATLMKWVLIGYFVVLALTVVVPFAAAWWLSSDQMINFKEVMQQTNGLSQGLFGILGVVVGFYFKSGKSDEEPDSE